MPAGKSMDVKWLADQFAWAFYKNYEDLYLSRPIDALIQISSWNFCTIYHISWKIDFTLYFGRLLMARHYRRYFQFKTEIFYQAITKLGSNFYNNLKQGIS